MFSKQLQDGRYKFSTSKFVIGLYIAIYLMFAEVGSRIGMLLFILFLMFLLLYIILLNLKQKQLFIPRRFLLFSFLMSFAFITSFWSIDRNTTILAATKFVFPVLCIYYISYFLTKRIGFYSFISIATNTTLIFTILSIPFTYHSFFDRFTGLFANSNQLGLLLSSICLPQIILLTISGNQSKNKVWSRVAVLIIIGLIISTLSRGSILMVCSGIIISVMLYGRKVNEKSAFLLNIFKKIVLIVLGCAVFLLVTLLRGSDTGSRSLLIKIGINLITFKGHGYGTSQRLLAEANLPWFNSWHNGFLGILIEGGWVWFSIGIWVLYVVVRDGIYLRRNNESLIGTIAIAVTFAWAFTQLFEFQLLRNSPIFYSFIAFSAAVSATVKMNSRDSRP
ncbi:hypothetical protein P9204_06790 [Geobacillus stearothermophilus]|nr:hypothetical protein [Geobacillus stearothermophilus]